MAFINIIVIWMLFSLGNCNEIQENLNLLGQDVSCFSPNKTLPPDLFNSIDNVSKTMIDGSKIFALKLFKLLSSFEPKSTSQGLNFSPASIWSTLIVTYLGSEGKTKDELSSNLKLNQLSKLSVSLAYKSIKWWKELKPNANKSDDGTIVASANKLYVDKSLEVTDCFKSVFGDEVEKKPFSSEPTRCLNEINSWVGEQTKGKISDLLTPASVTSMTQLLMVNAVYFKSFWAQQFDPKNTNKEPFFVSPTEVMEANMMSMESISVMFGISEELKSIAVDIPYSNPDYSMLIILPAENNSLDSLIRDLSLSRLQNLLENMYDDEVKLKLPRFKFEQEFDLAGTLFSMGITKLFDPRVSNLSAILKNSTKVRLNSVVHKSFITVNEEGTEAAAATAHIYARSGRPAFPTEFIANRPFLYMIRDVSSNLILFLGTVRRPFNL